MKSLCYAFAFALLCAANSFAQQPKIDPSQPAVCLPVTQRILQNYFSAERQLEILNSPVELTCLNYICAYSYEFAPGQMVLRSQGQLFNIERYKHLRMVDQRVSVFDEYSGLNVVLYSWNEVETRIMEIRKIYGAPATTTTTENKKKKRG